MRGQFEKKERELFGRDGAGGVIASIELMERELGIYELSQFSPGTNR